MNKKTLNVGQVTRTDTVTIKLNFNVNWIMNIELLHICIGKHSNTFENEAVMVNSWLNVVVALRGIKTKHIQIRDRKRYFIHTLIDMPVATNEWSISDVDNTCLSLFIFNYCDVAILMLLTANQIWTALKTIIWISERMTVDAFKRKEFQVKQWKRWNWGNKTCTERTEIVENDTETSENDI